MIRNFRFFYTVSLRLPIYKAINDNLWYNITEIQVSNYYTSKYVFIVPFIIFTKFHQNNDGGFKNDTAVLKKQNFICLMRTAIYSLFTINTIGRVGFDITPMNLYLQQTCPNYQKGRSLLYRICNIPTAFFKWQK